MKGWLAPTPVAECNLWKLYGQPSENTSRGKTDFTELFHIGIYNQISTFNRPTIILQNKATNMWVNQPTTEHILKSQWSESGFVFTCGSFFHSTVSSTWLAFAKFMEWIGELTVINYGSCHWQGFASQNVHCLFLLSSWDGFLRCIHQNSWSTINKRAKHETQGKYKLKQKDKARRRQNTNTLDSVHKDPSSFFQASWESKERENFIQQHIRVCYQRGYNIPVLQKNQVLN